MEFSKLPYAFDKPKCSQPMELPYIPPKDGKPQYKKAQIESIVRAPNARTHLASNFDSTLNSIYDVPNAVTVAKDFHRTICSRNQRKKYVRAPGTNKSTLHWGQRKLFMNELEFLTMFHHLTLEAVKSGITPYVLYVGSAHGIHLEYLHRLFPMFKWILYDPNRFGQNIINMSKGTNGSDRSAPSNPIFEIHNEYFTDAHAEIYGNKTKYPFIYYWSDIRSNEHVAVTGEHIEEKVYEDMIWQKTWHDIIKPVRTMLKFRLNWNDGFTTYLDGMLFIQPWTGSHSTEVRLITTADAPLRKYNNRAYEEQLFAHNILMRRRWYNFGNNAECESPVFQELCHCYDCASEYYILHQYLVKMNKPPVDAMILKMVRDITKIISRGGRDLYVSEHEYIVKNKDIRDRMRKDNSAFRQANKRDTSQSDEVSDGSV